MVTTIFQEDAALQKTMRLRPRVVDLYGKICHNLRETIVITFSKK